VGLLILGYSRSKSTTESKALTHPGLSPGVFRTAYSFSLMAAGGGSLFYHASLTRAGEWFDLVGSYLFLSLVMLYSLSYLLSVISAHFWAIYVCANILLGFQMAFLRELQQICFATIIGIAILAETWNVYIKRRTGKVIFLFLSLLFFLMGALMWAGQGKLLPCQPGALLPWHAIWHLLASLAAGSLYLYYQSR
jgi:hypothetical protein